MLKTNVECQNTQQNRFIQKWDTFGYMVNYSEKGKAIISEQSM